MNKIKILITGSGGFVGKNLYEILEKDFDVLGVSKTAGDFVDEVCDLSLEESVVNIFNNFNPDVVVHLASLSNVEKCESDNELAYKNNVLPVSIIARWVEERGKRLIYVSSDYVYDGVRGEYTEQEVENPIQYYGKTKLMGEQIVSSLKDYVILRPTVIYGWDPDGMNFFMQLYRNQKNSKVMNVPVDQISNPVSVSDLCQLIKKILGINTVGKFIATGNQKFSRYDFALSICDFMGWNKNLINSVNTVSLNQIAKRPLNNSTVNNLIVETVDFKFNNLKENIEFIKHQM